MKGSKLKLIWIAFAIMSVPLLSTAQNNIKQMTFVAGKTPRNIIFNQEKSLKPANNLDKKSDFKSQLTEIFKSTNLDNFKEIKVEADSLGNMHKSYQQYYKDIKIAFGKVRVHYNKNGLKSINGLFLPSNGQEISADPKISTEYAQQIAKEYFAKESTTNTEKVVINKYANIGKAEKIYIASGIESGVLKLSYKINVNFLGNGKDIYVDAENGKVLFSNSTIYNCVGHNTKMPENNASNIIGTNYIASGSIFETRYSGSRMGVTSLSNSQFYLRDYTRGSGIETFNAYNMASYYKDAQGNYNIKDGGLGNNSMPQTDYSDKDNYWSYDKTSPLKTNVALDVHLYTQNFYDYLKKTFDRNSIDDEGHKLTSYVNLFGNIVTDPNIPKDIYNYLVKYQGAVNAYWDGSKMVYYFGDNVNFDPVCSQDIVAHELGHGLCQNTAELIYLNESGALNEALSDIWGATIENANYGTSKKTWNMGEDIDIKNKQGIRNMQNPKQFGQPNTYHGSNFQRSVFFDNGGVHINSGVINYWFYLLSNGGNGQNDKGYFYDVKGIGIEKSINVVYEVETKYLTETSNFNDFRLATTEVAANLFGVNTPNYFSVMNAFNAVNINEIPEADIPCSSNNSARNDPANYGWLMSLCNPNSTVPISSNLQSGGYIAKKLFLPWEYPCSDGSYSTTVIPNGGNVTLESGDKLIIKGFKIESGAKFSARTCSNYAF